MEFQVNIKPKYKRIPIEHEKSEQISVGEISSATRSTNINQPDIIRTGRLDIGAVLTATAVGYSDVSEKRLTEILRPFSYTDILITLAKINILLQRSGNPSEYEDILWKNYCSGHLLDRINNRKQLAGRIIFNRESTLRLLSKSVSIANQAARRTQNPTDGAKKKLGNCYLIANEYIGETIPNVGTDPTEEKRKEIMVGLIPSLEYAINPSTAPGLKNKMVRSKEFLERFQEAPSNIDVNKIFFQATGLTLQDYQHLIFGILAVYLGVPLEEILKTGVLFIDTKPSQALTPLYEKLLGHTCISINELARKAATLPSLPNEFRLWRQNPLVKISENQIMCIDIGFLADKLETGVFWLIRDRLEKEKKGEGKKIIDLRGEVFEDYTASIIKRALPPIEAQTADDAEGYIVNPTYTQKGRGECTDIAVCGYDTLILLECKAPLLSAETKLSSDFGKFYDGIKPNAIKGIEQLWNAIQTLGHTNKVERCRVERINIFKVKKIYPVLVLSDRIFSLPSMNWFLNSEFQRFVKRDNLEDHLKIMPLTVLTIEDFEFLEPYLSDTPFHVHLDRWITRFKSNDSLLFSHYLASLREKELRQNKYIKSEFDQIGADIKKYFASRGID